MRILAIILACLSLSGCIDALVDMDFTDGETMQGKVELRLSRQLFDMMGKPASEVCAEGEHELSERHFLCRTGGGGSIDDLVATGWTANGSTDVDPARAAVFERIGNNRLRVAFDFARMMQDRPEQARPENMAGMEDMMRAALAGHSLIFRIRAREIIDTTGSLSEDGTTATRVIPMAAFLDDDPDFGPAFVTTLQLQPSCWFGLWCG